jgi:transposase InsO family protein
MDFIVELPKAGEYDAIFVCVDRLTKMAHFIPTNSNVTAERAAQHYVQDVFRLHGLPNDIVSDRGQQFTSRFTRRLLDLCDIKGNRSTAYHPQSDGQTERTNQTLEQYLRIYCDYQQDNWHELLPFAEFVYNNTESSSTRMTPFFGNYGYHPRCNLRLHVSTESINPTAERLVEGFRQLHGALRNNLQRAQEDYKEFHDRHVQQPPEFKVGDKVWLNRRNIRTTRPSQKLDVKRLGPFRISEAVGGGGLAFRLELPPQMRIHPVFHVSLLERYRESRLVGRAQTEPPPVEVEGELEYEVQEIVDSRIVRGKLKYLVQWEGYSQDERTWEPAEHLQHAVNAVADFHLRHPNRPSSQDL